MSTRAHFLKTLLNLAVVALVVLAFCPAAQCAPSEAEILEHIRSLRGIKPTVDKGRLAALNSRMDSAWKYLEGHKAESAPLVERELITALANPSDQFFVLDMGNLILTLNGKQAQSVALKALARI